LLLFWQNLTGKLQDWGFELNPHDAHVANKTIHKSQPTTLWHVGDIKVSHVDPQAVTDVLELLNKQECGEQIAELTSVTRGTVKIRPLKVQSGIPIPQTTIWRCPQ
jgi:hypothetical protein